MGHTTAATQPSEKLLLVWLLENRCLHFDYIMQVSRMQTPVGQILTNLSSVFICFSFKDQII
jgi:hypothetical protein